MKQACFKNEQRETPQRVLNERETEWKCPRGMLRSRWEQQVRKDVRQMEGRAWEESEKVLWEDRDRWRDLLLDPHRRTKN
jgi:hypothetical protein